MSATTDSENLMDPGNSSSEEVPVVQQIDNGVAFGYQCAKVVRDNTLTDIDLTMFLDISFPAGTQELAISYLQKQLVEAVSLHYGISTGTRCDDPLLGSSWLVRFLSQTTDWTKEDLFEQCRELSFEADTDDCFVYQVKVTGSVLDGNMDDVMGFISTQLLQGNALTATSPYQVGFLSVPVQDDNSVGGDTGRDNLSDPSSFNQAENSAASQSSDRQTVTIVGGLLVAAFCVAFFGIGFVLWRRRRHWLHQRDEFQLDALDKVNGGTEELDQYDSYNPNHASQSGDEEGPPGDEEGAFPNNITFDLGTSFKDQLMGVHGSQPGPGPPQPHHVPQHRTSGSDLGDMMMMGPGGYYGASRQQLNSDGGAASDSDADSWAQTDGTIGSLELQLEPITAEV